MITFFLSLLNEPEFYRQQDFLYLAHVFLHVPSKFVAVSMLLLLKASFVVDASSFASHVNTDKNGRSY